MNSLALRWAPWDDQLFGHFECKSNQHLDHCSCPEYSCTLHGLWSTWWGYNYSRSPSCPMARLDRTQLGPHPRHYHLTSVNAWCPHTSSHKSQILLLLFGNVHTIYFTSTLQYKKPCSYKICGSGEGPGDVMWSHLFGSVMTDKSHILTLLGMKVT